MSNLVAVTRRKCSSSALSRLSRAGGSRKIPVRYATPKLSSSVLSAGLRAHRKGRLAEALDHYEQRLLEEPGCLDAWMNLGTVQALLGRAPEAAKAFEHAEELAPENGRVLRDIGVGLSVVGRLAAAVSALERSVACAPGLSGSWLHLARIRIEVASRPLAVHAAQAAVQLRPDDSSAQFLLARCLFDDAPRAAAEALERAGRCPNPVLEAKLFQLLLASRDNPDAQHRPSLSQRLSELTERATHLSPLADAIGYLHDTMADARLFSGARDLLRFAAAEAPHEGNTVELGVFHGVSLRWLVECRPGRVHGFDSFLGLPSRWEPVPEGAFTTSGTVPDGIEAKLWIGHFEQQLPRYVNEHPEPIALLHVDSDLYASARSGLVHLGPLLAPGSVLVFDEFLGHKSWRQDEFRAFHETVRENNWHYETLAANPFTGQVAIRLT